MAQAFDGIASDVEHLSERDAGAGAPRFCIGKPASECDPAAPACSRRSVARLEVVASRGWGRASRRRTCLPGRCPCSAKQFWQLRGRICCARSPSRGHSRSCPCWWSPSYTPGMWLVWAVRTHAANHFASVTYAITAALILSPLLVGIHRTFSSVVAGFHGGSAGCVCGACPGTGMAAKPAGDSVGGDCGGGGHGSRTHRRDPRPGAVYGWIAGYCPGDRGSGLPGTPTHVCERSRQLQWISPCGCWFI